jgi:hypothetical protein
VLDVEDARHILGPTCCLTEDQIVDLMAQLHMLALVVMEEIGSRDRIDPLASVKVSV